MAQFSLLLPLLPPPLQPHLPQLTCAQLSAALWAAAKVVAAATRAHDHHHAGAATYEQPGRVAAGSRGRQQQPGASSSNSSRGQQQAADAAPQPALMDAWLGEAAMQLGARAHAMTPRQLATSLWGVACLADSCSPQWRWRAGGIASHGGSAGDADGGSGSSSRPRQWQHGGIASHGGSADDADGSSGGSGSGGGGGWLSAWLAAARGGMGETSPRDLSQSLWALARLSVHPGDAWLSAARARAAATARHHNAQDLATCLWALTVLRCAPGAEWARDMLAPLLTSNTAAARVTPRDAAQMLWALGATSTRVDARALHVLVSQLVGGSSGSSGSSGSGGGSSSGNSSGGSGGGGGSSGATSKRGSAGTGGGGGGAHPGPQDVANALWALATLRFQPVPALRAQLLAAAHAALEDGAPTQQQQLGHHSHAEHDASGTHGRGAETDPTRARAASDPSRVAPVLLWSLTRLGWLGESPLLLVAGARAALAASAADDAGAEGGQTHSGGGGGGGTLAPQGACLALYAFARAGYRPRPQLVSALLRALVPPEDCTAGGRADEGTAAGGTDGGARGTVGPGGGAAQLGGAQEGPGGGNGGGAGGQRGGTGGRRASAGLTAQTVALVLWSLGRLRYRPPEAWTRALLVQCVELLPGASAAELLTLAKGLAMLRFRPDALWAGVFASALASRLSPLRSAPSPFSLPLMTAGQAEAVARALPLIGMDRRVSGSGGGGRGGGVQLVTAGSGGGSGAVVGVGTDAPPAARAAASAPAGTARRSDAGAWVQAHPQQQVSQQEGGRLGCAACSSGDAGGRCCWSCEQQAGLWQRLDAALHFR
ncbi:hypothetical protein FOA52_012655 [Chlamydomonas sp. UWO 241]|nr:hypothetical protein FOA52_012655 [Chlamydomonas sp. UWO 241]